VGKHHRGYNTKVTENETKKRRREESRFNSHKRRFPLMENATFIQTQRILALETGETLWKMIPVERWSNSLRKITQKRKSREKKKRTTFSQQESQSNYQRREKSPVN